MVFNPFPLLKVLIQGAQTCPLVFTSCGHSEWAEHIFNRCGSIDCMSMHACILYKNFGNLVYFLVPSAPPASKHSPGHLQTIVDCFIHYWNPISQRQGPIPVICITDNWHMGMQVHKTDGSIPGSPPQAPKPLGKSWITNGLMFENSLSSIKKPSMHHNLGFTCLNLMIYIGILLAPTIWCFNEK